MRDFELELARVREPVRLARYRAFRAPTARTRVVEMGRDVLGVAKGWLTLRGRGARRSYLDRLVERLVAEDPGLLEWPRQLHTSDSIHLTTAVIVVQQFLKHLVPEPGRAFALEHITGHLPPEWRPAFTRALGLPSQKLGSFNRVPGLFSERSAARRGRRIGAASVHIVALLLELNLHTVRRRLDDAQASIGP